MVVRGVFLVEFLVFFFKDWLGFWILGGNFVGSNFEVVEIFVVVEVVLFVLVGFWFGLGMGVLGLKKFFSVFWEVFVLVLDGFFVSVIFFFFCGFLVGEVIVRCFVGGFCGEVRSVLFEFGGVVI